jgi:hypothetical protein
LVLLVTLGLLVTLAGRELCAFLTVNDPVNGGVLVIEGWAPPSVARAAIAEYHKHAYAGIYVTGEPFKEGDPFLNHYSNAADLMVDIVRKMGFPEKELHAVPSPAVGRDRTYTMARALKERLARDGVPASRINVFSSGPHSRRSRLLYEFAFGPGSKIGMVGVTPTDYEPDRWWTTSDGFRMVVGEFVAYIYARFLFHPPKN